jgi:CDP-diacylglycerol--serine O-phosphatidyltransferase
MQVFGVKDLFTVGNVLAGFAAIVLARDTELRWAAVAVFLGYVLDALDGVIARLTGSGNRFGAELDNVADLVTYSVAPAFVVFAAYRPLSGALAASLAVCPLLAGTLRFARFNVRRVEFPGYWVGLPRPASAVLLVSFCASRFFAEPVVAWAGAALVPVVSALNLSLLPYHGHHRRRAGWFFAAAVAAWLLSTGVAIPFGYLWEACFFWSAAYALGQHWFIPAEDRARFREFVREWRSRPAGDSPTIAVAPQRELPLPTGSPTTPD